MKQICQDVCAVCKWWIDIFLPDNREEVPPLWMSPFRCPSICFWGINRDLWLCSPDELLSLPAGISCTFWSELQWLRISVADDVVWTHFPASMKPPLIKTPLGSTHFRRWLTLLFFPLLSTTKSGYKYRFLWRFIDVFTRECQDSATYQTVLSGKSIGAGEEPGGSWMLGVRLSTTFS